MTDTTIDTYNKMADEYENETANFWQIFPHTFIDSFIEISGQKILDVGSGPGRDGLIFKESGKDVVCTDASEEMIKLSKSKGLESVLCSYESMQFDDSSFDAIWAYTSLLHSPKEKLHYILEDIYRILGKEGVLGLGLIEGDEEGFKEENSLSRWFSYYQKDEVIDILNAHGFELIYFETFKPRERGYLNFIFRKI